jgi:hypothetical protein
MSRLVIGLCSPAERVDQGAWKDDLSDIAPAALVDALQDAGLLVVLVSYDSSLVDDPDEVLRLLDGVVLQATPSEGREPSPGLASGAYQAFEQALADRAGQLGLPVARLGEAAAYPGAIREFVAELSARNGRR